MSMVATLGAFGQAGLAVWTHHFAYLPNPAETDAFVRLQYGIDDWLFSGPPPGLVRVSGSSPPGADGTVVIVDDCTALYLRTSYGWWAMERTSGSGRRVVLLAQPQLLSDFEGSIIVVSGDGWRIQALVVTPGSLFQLAYTSDDGFEFRTPLVELGTEPLLLDIVADPLTREVSIRRDLSLLMRLLPVASAGLTTADGWDVINGGDVYCQSLNRRIRAADR